MTEQELSAKEAYFEEQALFDLSDDEQDYQGESLEMLERALEDSKAMPPPTLLKQTSSFLGATPKERQAEFEAHALKHRTVVRHDGSKLIRSSTAPDSDLTQSFPVSEPQSKLLSATERDHGKKLKRVASLTELASKDVVPFYQEVGVVPRELKSGKSVKFANKIKLEPEHRQLLKGKIIYFYPNDDISMVRRARIHKVIQLGAAWVNRWRDDVTHIMLDDSSYTYSQLLRHLNRPSFSKRIVLINFDPYVPQCIQFQTILEPSAQRFAVVGAPQRTQVHPAKESLLSSAPLQILLQTKPSRRGITAQVSEQTDSHPTEDSLASNRTPPEALSGALEDIVKDSFIMTSPIQTENTEARDVAHLNDALSEAIEESKALAHLPLDDDDDDDTEPSSPDPTDQDNDSDTCDERLEVVSNHEKKSKLLSKEPAQRNKKSLDLNTFQCMDLGNNNSSSQNPNARTIQILEDMGRYYDQIQDTWRTLAYRKGVTTLKKQTVKITTAQQAAALPFIGSRLADKVEEIVLTDRLRKLDNTQDDPLDAVLRLFLGVYGAGLVQASRWLQTGYRTLDDLKTKARLTESQKIGIEHYNDFNSRIPRAEVEGHGAFVKETLCKIDDKIEARVMGSYRRGAKDSGDIDMIITRPGTSLANLHIVVFDKLVPQLYKVGFLKASLATSRSNDPTGSKWHGASCLPPSKIWRRMDFLLVPEEEMGAALIYFTGNDIFNRSIRLLARKNGMRLNQRGLYKDVKRGRQGEKLNEGVLVEGKNEKRIFEVLGVPWRKPHERIC